jgi:hypothetical protein
MSGIVSLAREVGLLPTLTRQQPVEIDAADLEELPEDRGGDGLSPLVPRLGAVRKMESLCQQRPAVHAVQGDADLARSPG